MRGARPGATCWDRAEQPHVPDSRSGVSAFVAARSSTTFVFFPMLPGASPDRFFGSGAGAPRSARSEPVGGAGAAPRPVASRPIPAGAFVAACDVIVVLSMFFAMIIGINLDRMPNGLDAFLSLSITVRNVLVIAGFATGIVLVLGGSDSTTRPESATGRAK